MSESEKRKEGSEGGERLREPLANFSGFVVSIAETVLLHLGEIPDPSTGQICRNVEQARYSIDILDMLEAKTKGNLTPDEEYILNRVRSDLKLKFVRRS